MIRLRRPRPLLAVLIAILLAGIAVPSVDARLPRARPYLVGGPITLDTNLLSVSGASAWAIDRYLAATTSLPPLGPAFLAAERTYGINARFLLAAALHESGWGRSYLARVRHNLFGYNAYDRDPGRYATPFATFAANIDAVAKFIKEWYLTPGGRWWGGQPTLRSMQQSWSSSRSWGVSVSRLATDIHLDTIAGRPLAFTAPAVGGHLHGGDPAPISLIWTGGAIPGGVEFVADWQPIELESDVIAATLSRLAAGSGTASDPPVSTSASLAVGSPAPDGPASSGSQAPASSPPPAAGSPGPGPADRASAALSEPARETGATAASLELVAPAPPTPGRYVLTVHMVDAGGGPLPAGEQIQVPAVEVRVWGDRAVSYDVGPSPDGTGLAIRITNTGRTTIPASAPDPSVVARDPDIPPARSVVRVTAAAGSTATARPVLLLVSPLPADLPPGASIALAVSDVAGSTGRATSWVEVELTVLGSSAWLAATPPAGTWFSVAAGPRSPAPQGTPAPSVPAG